MGDQLYEQGDYYGASIWYKKALNIDSTFVDIIHKYASSLRMYNDYKKAENYYYQVYKKDRGRTYPKALYWYATMLKHNEKYKDAKKYFKRSKRFFSRSKKGFYYQKVLQEIKSCEWAYHHQKEIKPITIKNVGQPVNTYSSEFGPTLINDSTMFFSTLRDEKMTENNIISDTTAYLVRLFKANKEDSIWNTIEKLDEIINEKNMHIGNGCFNNKGDVFYYSKCNRNYNCKIYAIQYINEQWQKPYEIKALNIEGYTSTQPQYAKLNNGTEVLFFASNRPGGKGKLDIWYSLKNDYKIFMPPINCGSKINTIDDEITPFYNTKDTSLYFSSQWHKGFGGFDVFKSTSLNLNKFTTPKNMLKPINTSTNDIYYSIKNNTGILASNRKGSLTKKGETCCNDIYSYKLTDTIPSTFSSLDELNKYLPVTLYFHNDEPNPRTRDTVTKLNYLTTVNNYIKLIDTYKKEYAKDLKGEEKDDAILDIEDFFEEYVVKGVSNLKMFTPLLLAELKKGKSITLTIKGYASPLSKTDYNVNLTLRRVSSLINYLKEYDNGVFLPYINKTDNSGGELLFVKVPFGEYQSIKSVSDNINDKRNSIYSRNAALERKIEIIAISENDSTALDGSEKEKLPELTFSDSLHCTTTTCKIFYKNAGKSTLKVFNIKSSCNDIKVNISTPELAINEEGFFEIEFKNKQKPYSCTFTLLTNTIPNTVKKEIEFKALNKQ